MGYVVEETDKCVFEKQVHSPVIHGLYPGNHQCTKRLRGRLGKLFGSVQLEVRNKLSYLRREIHKTNNGTIV